MVPENGTTQSVRRHLEGTMKLAEKNCPLDILKNTAIVAALLHDAGKLSQDFFEYMRDIQKYGEKARPRLVDHTSAGGWILEEIVGRKRLTELIGTAVFSHHGLQDCVDMETGETLAESRRRKPIDFETIRGRYFEIVDREVLIQYLKNAHKDVQSMVGAISQWVNSKGQKCCGDGDFYMGMYERLLLSILIDSDWTDTACFCQGEEAPERLSEEQTQRIWEESIEHFERYMENLTASGEKSPLNTYRNEISDLCCQAAKEQRNLYRLTVPTGAGKTLSSLRFALHHAQKYHKRHIIYVAPYNSILEQNAEDIRQAVGNEAFVLEHHCNIFYEDEKRALVYKKLTENWDVPIIATTAVQMLNTLFSSQKSSIRRMYNLCNSVIIFDEVQAFPVKGTELFNLAVNFLAEFCSTTVILCSATQPSLARLRENNLYDCAEMTGSVSRYAEAFQRVEIEDKTDLVPGGMEPLDLGKFALEAFQKYGSVLIVVNTKRCAKQVYRCLRESGGDTYSLYHLSTSMCPENRREELREIKEKLKNGEPVICVSTQLIEAGVNVSFGCVIRSLAGLDSIVQAAGRCNRHKELEMGKVYIVKMSQKAENLNNLYDIKAAQKASDKFLYHFKVHPECFDNRIDSEQAVTAYYKEYFRDAGAAPTKYPSKKYVGTTLEELLGRNRPASSQYKRRHEGASPPFLRQAFRAAGEDYEVIPESAKVTVVIPYDDAARRNIEALEDRFAPAAEQKKAIRILQRYSVGISESQMRELGQAIHKVGETEILVLSMDYYDRKEGVLEEPQNRFLNF